MKRLAVVFTGWRDQRDAVPPIDKHKKLRTAPAALAAPPVPKVVYSSSSSDGSVVQTPDPDDDLRHDNPPSRWATWIKPKPSKPKTTHVAAVREPQPRISRPLPLPVPSESDDESDHYGDDTQVPPPPSTPTVSKPTPRTLHPALVQRAQANMHALTLAALLPCAAPPPLLHLPGTPLFPRSMNPSRTLPRTPNTHIVLLRTSLLRRLEACSLSRTENESIVLFGDRPRKTMPNPKPQSRPGVDEEAALYMNKKVRDYSRGLQVWLDRPCFEERCVLWTWNGDGSQVIVRGVIGSGRAIASLEFSEGIEALAGYHGDSPELDRAPALQVSPGSIPTLNQLHITSPPSPGSSTPNASTGPPTPTSAVPRSATQRKVLRFVDHADPDDDEDNVPLGYHVRGKREREERARQVEEQVREEERVRKALADEVKAARARREGARSGMMHETELERLKDRRANYTRPAYDPAQLRPSTRRMASEPDPHSHSREPPTSLSRPPSTPDVKAKARPASIRSESLRPPNPPPPLPRSSTAFTPEELQAEKRRRRVSAVSEGGSVRTRPPSAPSTPPSRFEHEPPLPRTHSLGPSPSGMGLGLGLGMGMIAPSVPIPPMPMIPVYPVVPGQPQFFYAPPPIPLLPHMRPGLPVSRSVEGVTASRTFHGVHAGRQESPRRSNFGGDARRLTPANARQTPHAPSSMRGSKPSHAWQ